MGNHSSIFSPFLGLDAIEKLQEHENSDIYKLSYEIIEKHFGDVSLPNVLYIHEHFCTYIHTFLSQISYNAIATFGYLTEGTLNNIRGRNFFDNLFNGGGGNVGILPSQNLFR